MQPYQKVAPYFNVTHPQARQPPLTRHMHPNTFILIIKPTTPIFKNQIAQIEANTLLITEENGLEVSGYVMGVILYLALAN
jgi:hypothetical protein